MSSRKCRESQRKQNNIRNITEIKACKKPIELKKIKNELSKCFGMSSIIILNYAEFNSFT